MAARRSLTLDLLAWVLKPSRPTPAPSNPNARLL
jgi:hypothetical protein